MLHYRLSCSFIMKRTELILSVLLVPIDLIMLVLAAWAAHRTRFWDVVEGIRPVLYDISLFEYLQSALIAAFIWVAIFAIAGLYRRKVTDSWLSEAGRVVAGCSAGLVSIVLLVFLQRELFSSRFIILAAYVFAIVFVLIGRLLVRLLERQLFKWGYGSHRVAVIGECEESDRVVRALSDKPELGYKVVARVPASTVGLGELSILAENDLIDEIHFVEPAADKDIRILFFEKAERYHLAFRYAPDLLWSPIGVPSVDIDAGVPLIEVPETKLIGWGRVLKRLFDIVASIFGLLLLSPVMLLVAVIVVFDSGFPIIYKSMRVGRGRVFAMYKFRTMKLEYCVGEKYGGNQAEKMHEQLTREQSARTGIIPKVENDPRVTRVGRWLRKYSLDELPQLFNVLLGGMSLVGPRPHLPNEVARYSTHHHKVLAIKPGITGLAQVNGRSDIDFEEEVKLDRYYIEQWSFWLDMRILVRTIPAVLRPPKQT